MNVFEGKAKVFTHLVLWGAFVAIEVTLVYIIGVRYPWYRFALFYVMYIGMFYLATFIFLRYKKIETPWVIMLIIAEIGITTILLMYAENLFRPPNEQFSFSDMIRIKLYGGLLLRELFFIALAFGYYNAIVALRNAKEASALRIQKIEAEKSILYLQNAYQASLIRPHLLYNTLHFMNGEQELADKSAQSVSLLTEIMRYAIIKPDGAGTIELMTEVQQVRNLLALYETRLEGQFNVKINIDLPREFELLRITPFLLGTLAENILKHAELSDEQHPAVITIGFEEDWFVYRSQNKKNETPLSMSGSLGMEHIRWTLEAYYPGHLSQLVINDTQDSYKLTLKLKL